LKSFLIAEQRSEYDSPATAELSAEYFEQEASRLLVLASLEIRLLIDNAQSSQVNELTDKRCGSITSYVEDAGAAEAPLNFKKAYNSIIHAREIIFRDPDQPYKSYNGIIVTRNRDKGERYQAKINGLNFIQYMLDCINLVVDN